ncbi:MAG: DUF4254 domain-containing protein [Bacteroidota bacterium]
MTSAADCYRIFEQSVADYHQTNHVDAAIQNPHPEHSFEALCYLKNWIDTVQWHLEDIVRDPKIDPVKGLELKRRIDRSNQHRTDVVEQMDDRFVQHFSNVHPSSSARLNSETPAWLLDRMSILVLKIWHMREQTERSDAAADHIERCNSRLAVLLEQRADMAQCFDELMEEVAAGTKRIKVYRQMKMYNDSSMNPVLYQKKS